MIVPPVIVAAVIVPKVPAAALNVPAKVAFPPVSTVKVFAPDFFPKIPVGDNHKPLLASVFIAIAPEPLKVKDPKIVFADVFKFAFIKAPDESMAVARVEPNLPPTVDVPSITAPAIVITPA